MARQPVTDLAAPPSSGICFLQARFKDLPDVVRGTGFLVGPGRVATAGHVLWSDLEGHATRLTLPDFLDIFMGDGLFDENAHLSWTLTFPTAAVVIHPQFLAGDAACDVAKITLPHQLTGVLAMQDFPGALQAGDDLTLSGYPADLKPFGAWEASGSLHSTDTPVFKHQVETSEGQSGAPVRRLVGGEWAVVGIHLGASGFAEDGQTVLNEAAAITPAIRAWLLN